MRFDDESAKLVSDLVILAYFLADKWSAGVECPEEVEEKQGDFMAAMYRAGMELKKAGYPVPDIFAVWSPDFHFGDTRVEWDKTLS